MKRFSKSMQGVTLLEIMLVLSVAAMIIVMSVRYYQAANNSQQANVVLQQVQGITAAADGLAQAAGTYTGITTAAVTPLMPNGQMTTPWGSAITVTNGSATGYLVTIAGMPAAVCALLTPRLTVDTKFTITSGACGAAGTNANFTYTYNSQG